jgi:hypothetical protein
MTRRVFVAGAALACACGDHFSVRPTAPTEALSSRTGTANAAATFSFPLATSAASIRGDGLFASGLISAYSNGVCGVTATVFAPNPTQDAVLQTDNPQAGDRKCVAYSRTVVPRSVIVDYGVQRDSSPVTLNVHDLGSVSGTSLRFLGLALSGPTICEKVQFGGPAGGDMVWVTRTSATTWHIYSQAAPANTATCVTAVGNTVIPSMSVDLTVSTP